MSQYERLFEATSGLIEPGAEETVQVELEGGKPLARIDLTTIAGVAVYMLFDESSFEVTQVLVGAQPIWTAGDGDVTQPGALEAEAMFRCQTFTVYVRNKSAESQIFHTEVWGRQPTDAEIAAAP